MPKISKFKTTLIEIAKDISPIVSMGDMENLFPETTYDGYKSTLMRMQKRGEVLLVWKGIYIINPKEYFGGEYVHLKEYLDVVMHNMNKDYYVSLRGAMAEYSPSTYNFEYYDIIVERPGLHGTVGDTKPSAYFVNSASVPSSYIINKETRYGSFRLATRELLAIDLITYPNVLGSLQASVNVLKVLLPRLNFRRLQEDIFKYRTAANIQRLGYIIENVLDKPAKAQPLHDLLDKRYNKVYARNALASALPLSHKIDKRWQLDVNIELEG